MAGKNEELRVKQKLYGLMSDLFSMQPWEFLFEDDLFAVADPNGGETAYVSIMGELGEHHAVGAYLGANGIYNLWRMWEGDDSIKPEMLMETPQLQASFEDRQMLQPEDLKVIRQLGLTYRGKQSWPMFRSFRPGFMPWFTDDKENRFLVHILEQTLYVAKRVKKNSGFLEHVSDIEFFARIPATVNGVLTWKDGAIAVPPPPPAIDIPFMLVQDTIGKLQKRPLVDTETEIDFSLFPSFIGEKGKRPLATYMLLMADHANGLITGQNLLQAEGGLENMWGKVPQEICNMMVMHDERPGKVYVQTGLLFQLLQPIANILDIDIVQVDRLPAIEEAKASLRAFMSKR